MATATMWQSSESVSTMLSDTDSWGALWKATSCIWWSSCFPSNAKNPVTILCYKSLLQFGTSCSTILGLHFIHVFFGILEWNKTCWCYWRKSKMRFSSISTKKKTQKCVYYCLLFRESHIINQENYVLYWNDSLVGWV